MIYVILIGLGILFFMFGIMITKIVYMKGDTHQNNIDYYLSPYDKEQMMNDYIANKGFISPETQQKIYKAKYISPESLQRDLEFYNQYEYIGKFTKGDEQWLKK